MKLPKELTTVTRLSILLTAISSIVLVLVAFYLGMEYQMINDLRKQELINAQSTAVTKQKPSTPISTISPSASLTQQKQSLQTNTPSSNAQAFYQWYIDCLNSPTISGCNYRTNKYISNKLVERITAYDENFKKQCGNSPGCSHGDLILCAQNVPQKISVDDETSIGDKMSTVIVHTIYDASDDNPLIVSLEKESNTWKITSISCARYSLL